MDFGDLQDDKSIQEKITNVHNNTSKIDKMLELALNTDVYEKLSTQDKVNFDLFVSFTLNTLFWVYLRTQGIDPNTHDIKNELGRVREYMIKAKQAVERNTIRPRLDQAAAKRFVKHGIQHAGDNTEVEAKRRKFDN